MCWVGLMAIGLLAGCRAEQPSVWRGECRFVDASTDWHMLEMTVPARNYRAIRLYLRLQRATGTVWFDRVEAPGLKVKNPSFEEVKGNDIVWWGQDDEGRTIFTDESTAADGRRSVRITRKQRGMSRIWQDLRVEPGRRYKVRVWARWRGIRGGGAGYGEVYGINPDGSLGAILTSTYRLTGTSQRVVQRWWEMAPQGDRAQAWCPLAPPQPGTYQLVLPVDASKLDGRLVVELRADGSLSRATVSGGDGWQAVQLCGRLPGPGRLLVTATGRGTARVKKPQLQHVDITPAPQQITWRPPRDNFRLGARVTIVVPPDAKGRRLKGPRWLAREIAAKAGSDVKVLPAADYAGAAIYIGGKLARAKLQTAGVAVPNKPEGYAIAVRRDFVAAAGRDERGDFYAAVTLLWLTQKVGDSADIVAADIADWPALPFRGTYGIYGDSPEAAAEVYARLKLNAVVVESGDWYHLDNPAVQRKWQRAAEVFRQYWIDFIPELQSFGHGGAVVSVDPRCVEGEWIRGEKHVLRGQTPVELKRRNVLVTDATHIEVTSADGKTRYQEGRDFRVIPGKTVLPFRSDNAPWKIARIPAGRIPDGATVLVSYDCAPRRWGSYCPNEPLVYKIMGKAIRNAIRYIRPRWLHVGHDEIAQMNSDSRCRRAGRSNAENLAMELKRLLGFAREVDPKIKIMLWADMLNPYHNGKSYHPSDPTFKAAEMLPPDGFIMNVWFYGATQPRGPGWMSLKWFDERGFATTGSPWYNHRCAALWGDVCGLARRKGMKCMGVLYTSWSRRWDALSTMADHAWHPLPVQIPK